MSARDLVGRPLVPFFDAHDNVNESLAVDAHANEQLDVDARVWDKELGYFVYPNESAGHSMPIPIKKAGAPASAQDGGSGSFGKMLLTPDMLSRSAPSGSGSHSAMGMTHAVDHHAPSVQDVDATPRAATPRSASAKRSSRGKNRSSTPNRNTRNKQRENGSSTQPQQQTQSANDGGSSGGEDKTASDSSEKTKTGKKNKNSKERKSRNKQPQTPQKSKEGDLSANGKWAWSAFQSSPDPKSLPLPPFVAGGSPGMGALPPPMDPPKIEERLDPPPPPLFPGRPPSMPPDAMMGMAPPLPPPHPTSLEHSMTQDLRRMLNIGS